MSDTNNAIATPTNRSTMARRLRIACALRLLPLLLLGLSITGSVAQLAVQLTGGFTNQSFTITHNNGSYDEINISATVVNK